MILLIFKTDIETKEKVESVGYLLDNHPVIGKWSIDTEDVDNVLKVEVSEDLHKNEIIGMVNSHGFSCEELVD